MQYPLCHNSLELLMSLNCGNVS